MHLAAEGQARATKATGTVASLATLHVDAAGGKNDQNKGANGDDNDVRGGEVRSRLGIFVTCESWIYDLNLGGRKNGIIKAESNTWRWLLLAARFQSSED